MSVHDPHPAAAPAITALNTLAHWTPANAGELARILQAIHAYGQPSIITALHDALDHLTETLPDITDLTDDQRELTDTWISRASERLGFISEALDAARLATGTEWPR